MPWLLARGKTKLRKRVIMQFIYRYAYLPANRKDLVNAANAAASRIYEKLIRVGVRGPRMDE